MASATSRLRIGWLCLSLLAAGLPALSAPPPPLAEHQIKALYLFNFAKYIEWPEPAFASHNAPFVIGIMGAPDIIRDLEEITRGKLLKNRPVHIMPIQDKESLGDCQMVFIGSVRDYGAIRAVTVPSQKPVLTVGDSDTFLDEGGVIKFFKQDNTLHMEISLKHARLAGLAVSAKLLAVSHAKTNTPPTASP